MENNIIYTNIIVFIVFILGFVFWQSRKDKIDNLTVTLLTVALSFVLFSMWAPKLFTQHSSSIVFNEETGQIGDTIGGIMNPFISMAAVIVTGMAFYAQYRANEMVRKQFELQKFENQFYEMLRLHKENVNEIEVKTSDRKEVIKGREVFVQLKEQLETLLHILESELRIDLNPELYSKIYDEFFMGFFKRELGNSNYFIGEGDEIRNENENKYDNWRVFIQQRKIECIVRGEYSIEKSFNLKLKISLLDGHQSYLAHYFRHLFHTVKFVVSQDEKIISKDKKLNYLRILRAQLSNHEQIILFYNWLGGDRHGGAWENDTNQFFTKYKMIHNMWYSELYKNSFVKEKLEELVRKHKLLGRKEKLFEIGDDIDKNFS